MAMKEQKKTAPQEIPAAPPEPKKGKKKQFEVNPEISFSVTEAYKALRTNINFAIPGTGCKSFLVTSAVLAEGKTTTATSLALTIAQMDARVIIVDADMRRPKVHSKFKMVNKIGLSNFLSGMCTLDEIIQKVPNITLDIIPAGTIPPNPAELLANSKMAELMNTLKERYDYIILDTPPVNIVADALPLAKLVDGVLLIVRHRQSAHPELAAAISRLEFADAHILGMVLNGMEETMTYYRGRYKRYSRKYGYGYGKKKKKGYGYGYGYGYGAAPAPESKPAPPRAPDTAKSE